MKDSTLIVAGGFKVDRERALDKLMRFQLQDAGLFALPLIRCAVAGGATRVELIEAGGQLTVRFDGRPFTEAELSDPYGCLFDKHVPENRRNRELAVALLSALRLSPKNVSLLSGPPGKRIHLQARSPNRESLEPSDSESPDNAFAVRHGSFLGRVLVPRLLPYLNRCPIPVKVYGGELSPDKDPEGQAFAGDGRRGWVGIPADVAAESLVQFHCLGVKVAPYHVALPGIQVEGWVDDPEFTLNASQSGIARNRRFELAKTALSKAALELLGRAARGQRERLAPLGPILVEGWRNRSAPSFEGWHYYWQYRLEGGSAWDNPGFLDKAKAPVNEILYPVFCGNPDLHKETIANIRRAARVTAWLRDAAMRLLAPGVSTGVRGQADLGADMGDTTKVVSPGKQAAAPELADLWAAPVFFSVGGVALSALELHEQAGRLGYVPTAREPSPDRGWPFHIVWLTSAGDELVLRRLFSDQVRDLTGTLTNLAAPRAEEAEEPALAAAGVINLLARKKFVAGAMKGELGLSAAPSKNEARIHAFAEGLPAGFHTADWGLRFEAAVDLGASGKMPWTTLELAEAAGELYELLAVEYSPGGGGHREFAVRGHLLDYLFYRLRQNPVLTASSAWLMDSPLLEINGRWVGLKAARAILEEGNSIGVRHGDGPPRLPLHILSGAGWTDERLRLAFPGCPMLSYHAAEGARLIFMPMRPAESLLDHKEPHSGWDPADRLNKLAALLEESGTMLDQPNHPVRAFVLESIPLFITPSGIQPGMKLLKVLNRTARLNHLRELLEALPLFRAPGGPGLTIFQVDTLIAGEGGLRYIGPVGKAEHIDVNLSPQEQRLFDQLWPGQRERLNSAAKSPPVDVPTPKVMGDTAKVGFMGDTTEVVSPTRAQSAAAESPAWAPSMLFTNRYQEGGLNILIGLPFRSQAPRLYFTLGERRLECPGSAKALPTTAVIIADVSRTALSGGGLDARALLEQNREPLTRALLKFYGDFLTRGPVLEDHSGAPNPAAALAILRIAAVLRRKKSPEASSVLMKILQAKLFRTLGGGRADLRSLADAASDGTLVYAAFTYPAMPKEAAKVPIIPTPWRRLVGSLIGGDRPARLTLYRPPPRRAPRALSPNVGDTTKVVSPPQALEPAPVERTPLVILGELLARLRGRRGALMPELRVVPDHVLPRAVLSSRLSMEEKAAYLASIVSSLQNRESSPYSDLDDENFQQALAHELAGPKPG